MDLITRKNKKKMEENSVDPKYVKQYQVLNSVTYLISCIVLLESQDPLVK